MSSSHASTALLARFLAGGAFNTAFGLALILLLMRLGASPLAANIGGYAGGLLLSFAVNRGFVFRGRGPLADELPRYVLAFAISYGLNIAVLLGLAQAGINAYLAQLIAVGAYVLLMFLLCRRFVFRQRV